MVVSIHQPAYLPWLGYLARIACSDLFIFLDTVQFEKNSFINRNRIKTPNGPLWLTVPVCLKGHVSKVLTDMRISNQNDWVRKHLRSIEQHYNHATMFSEHFPTLSAEFSKNHSLLTELCFDQLHFWLRELCIENKIIRASDIPVNEKKSDLILSLCRYVGANIYLSGPMGRYYLKEDDFIEKGIQIKYYNYVHPVYYQLYGNFIPDLSIVDYWMNCSDPSLFRRSL